MKVATLTLLLTPSAVDFAPVAVRSQSSVKLRVHRHSVDEAIDRDDDTTRFGVQHRRDALKTASILAITSAILGFGPQPQQAQAIPEQKTYSSNANNMARLGSGDSSAGSIYDNNPSSPKARGRRAMVACKQSPDARSLVAESLGTKQLSEKDCNILVMSGETDVVLDALTKLDCPTCAYGIGTR